ncbi:MAG: cytochrome ubiquinol oxidase subunit I [Thermodesulfobacteriota bacterium]
MNYPVWEVFSAGGGFLIALISIVHVYVAHFAVGGGLFLVMTERKAYRENAMDILDYVKTHTRFFLLLTLVFGGLTGVGIWFVIALYSPSATSRLIHVFLFGWAAEWVCFTVEITAILLYYYTFSKISRSRHLILGWIYFISAWLSLFLINGIIAFMLTPGEWIETRNFWHGFFNPSMFPSLFFRTAVALVLAGVYGFVTASFIKKDALRETMIRYCAGWLLLPFGFMILFAVWYVLALPEDIRAMVLEYSPETAFYGKAFVVLLAVLFCGGLVMAIRMPHAVKKPMAFFMLAAGLFYLGSFEFIREAGRRPYIISNHMFSNSIEPSQAEKINKSGILKAAKWSRTKEVTNDNTIEAGRAVFSLECLACHSVGGPLNDIAPLTEKYSASGMEALITGLGRLNTYMPPFFGTEKEKKALAEFIAKELHGKIEPDRPAPPAKRKTDIPSFDPDSDEYVLLAWSATGMQSISDCSDILVFQPPGTTIHAQLIKRGPLPEVITRNVEIAYSVEPGFKNPSGQVSFWENAPDIYGRSVEPDTGLAGFGVQGKMAHKKELNAFAAEQVPVVPYPDKDGFMPYPLFNVKAVDRNTGDILARTSMAAGVSTELGCKSCHGGEWRVSGKAGISEATAMDILETHDKNEKTELAARAEKGSPVRCAECHTDPAGKKNGDTDGKRSDSGGILNFSAAIHGFHANYLSGKTGNTCLECHPSRSTGKAGGLRDIHMATGLDCTDCHGTMEDHSIALLKQEREEGKSVDRLMEHLTPVHAESVDEINPRTPWVQQPDCLNCHLDYGPPEMGTAAGFNKWTDDEKGLYRMRSEELGMVMCQACHGTTHAVYPAENMYGENRDNIPAMQYQKTPLPLGTNRNCSVCHTMDMDFEIHHENMTTPFRNDWILDD